MTDEWTEAGYCAVGCFVGFLLFAIPKIAAVLL